MRLHPAFILLALFLVSCGKEKVIDTNQRIHHDDFEYTVLSYATMKTIGHTGRVVGASGLFYVVTFQVENRARRVNHHWSDNIAYVTDQEGTTYENNSSARALLYEESGRQLHRVFDTPAGRTDTALFVFDLPASVHEPCLKVRGDFLMGDLLDGNAYASTRVKLY